MTKIPYIPETAPFTLEQRAWLNGFLAGMFANGGGNEAPQLNSAPPKAGEPLPILFGSQTGTAEGIAKRIAKEAAQRGFAPVVLPLNDHSQADLAKGGKAIIISSTWGDGDPPDNATNFWSWLQSDAPRLENLHFAVLGLGDKNYSDFCGAAKKFDSRLENLGARRLVPRGECDTDYEVSAKTWVDDLWEKLTPGPNGAATNGHAVHTNGHTATNGHAPAAKSAFGKSNPFPAKLLKNILLNKTGSAKEVRHYEISLAGSGLTYEAGDALGVVPVNCPALVDEMLGILGCSGTESVSLSNTEMALREALTRHLDMCKPSQELLAATASRAPNGELASLLAPERRDDLKQFLWGRDAIDLIRLIEKPFSPAELVPLLRKLAPRLYSISSSPKAHPDEVHLTVSAVRYESFGRGRKGVASTFLADRIGDADFVKVFVQPSHGFKPPTNADAPMIMVGPGTGIAPFRAFLEERKACGAKGKNWLFFGDQKRDADYLYDTELDGWKREGHLTRLDLAFSRDQDAKIYVQDRMLQNAADLWAWLEAGAHFYVCGDASRMAKDVDAALHRIVETAGGKSADEARAYVAKLKSDKRYQRDVY
jgi:sulfite reductase (NADPH) flavoprotein alpha-component